jgi:hypothetical protein
MMTEIMLIAIPGMVGMGVGNDSPLHRLPGINVKISCRAINTLICKL